MAVTLAGNKVTRGSVNVPAWGAWYADASVDGEVTLSGAVDLVVADVTFKGTVLSGGPAKGRSFFRIVGGKAGWGKRIPKKSYANDAGVKASTVLADAASAAGETLDTTTIDASMRLGPAWARKGGETASSELERITPSAWYVGEDGVTRIGRRPAVPFTDQATRTTFLDLARKTVTLAAEKIAKLTPGAVVDGLEAVDVVHEFSAKGGLRSTIFGKRGTSGTSRMIEAVRLILDQLDPDRAFRGVYEYRVVTLGGKRVNLQPVLVSTGMPDLQRVPIRPGLAGSRSDLALGSRVLVGFVNADPARPAVLAMEDADGDGFKPVLTEIDAQTFVKLGAGVKPAIGAGDLAGIFPCVSTQAKVLI